MKIAFLLLFLSSSQSFAADYLSELKSQFKLNIENGLDVFEFSNSNEYSRKSHKNTRVFKESWHKKIESSEQKALLFPPGIVNPKALYTLEPQHFFGISSLGSTWYSREKGPQKTEAYLKTEKKVNNAYLDVIFVYWQGYIAFMEELCGQEGSWQKFEKGFSEAFFTASFTSSDNIEKDYSPSSMIDEENKMSLLPQFFAHYALGIFFHPNNKISPQLKIKALRLWQQMDPEFKFLSSLKKSYYYYDICKNLMPETFDVGLVEDEHVDYDDLFKNPTIIKIFGEKDDWNKKSFQLGLLSLQENYKQELVQVVHSIFIYSIDKIYGQMILNFLMDLSHSDDPELLGLVLGQHASYRNKGRITLVMDGLEQLSKQTLIDTIRSQKIRLKHLEEEGKNNLQETMAQKKAAKKVEKSLKNRNEKLKELFLNNRAVVLLTTFKTDDLGWLKAFRINPMLSHEENMDNIKKSFHRLSLQFHPDKQVNQTAQIKVESEKQMKAITGAYEYLSKEEQFTSFIKDNCEKAKKMALTELEEEQGSF